MKEKEKASAPLEASEAPPPTFKESAHELTVLTNLINAALKGDKDLAGFTISDGRAPGAELADGAAMVKAFDKLIPGVVDVRAMNKTPKDLRDKVENWNLVLGSARSAGCRLVHVTAEALAGGNETQIQAVVWETLRVAMETRVKKAKVYLEGAFPKEKVADLLRWPMEKVLGGWLSSFIGGRGHAGVKIASLANDCKDGLAYVVVLAALLKRKDAADVAALAPKERLAAVEKMAAELGLDAVADGLASGAYWQHYLLAAQLLVKASEVIW